MAKHNPRSPRWWTRRRRGYLDPVGASHEQRIPPVPRPAEFDDFVGRWVAVVDGRVIAAEDTSHRLALRLHDMDHRRRRKVVVEYVRPTADSYIVGVG